MNKLIAYGIFTISILFQAVREIITLSPMLLVYPYALIALFGVTQIGGQQRLGKYMSAIGIAYAFIGLIIAFQIVVLRFDPFYVFYAARFYFGFILLFPFTYFIINKMEPKNLFRRERSLNRFIEILIFVQFSMCMIEFALALTGAGLAPWHPTVRQEWDLRSIHDIDASYRAYGFTANSAVLGGLTSFIMFYYLVKNIHKLGPVSYATLIMGSATVALSQSGTGYFTFIAGIGLLLLLYRKIQLVLIGGVLLGLLWGLLSYLNQGETDMFYRYSFSGLMELMSTGGSFAFDFVISTTDGIVGFIFGSMNFMELTQNNMHFGLIEGGASLYDYAPLAVYLETGMLGLCVVLFTYWKLLNLTYGKRNYLYKMPYLILGIATLHYGTAFWVCSQIIAGIFLAYDAYAYRSFTHLEKHK